MINNRVQSHVFSNKRAALRQYRTDENASFSRLWERKPLLSRLKPRCHSPVLGPTWQTTSSRLFAVELVVVTSSRIHQLCKDSDMSRHLEITRLQAQADNLAHQIHKTVRKLTHVDHKKRIEARLQTLADEGVLLDINEECERLCGLPDKELETAFDIIKKRYKRSYRRSGEDSPGLFAADDAVKFAKQNGIVARRGAKAAVDFVSRFRAQN
jgi:hypothetical protein